MAHAHGGDVAQEHDAPFGDLSRRLGLQFRGRVQSGLQARDRARPRRHSAETHDVTKAQAEPADAAGRRACGRAGRLGP
jgi:hypothetical protein